MKKSSHFDNILPKYRISVAIKAKYANIYGCGDFLAYLTLRRNVQAKPLASIRVR